MALRGPFGHLQNKLWQKEGPRVKLTIWLLTTKKSRIDPTPVRASGVQHTVGNSRGKLQVCFRPHPNQRSKQGVMIVQSPKSPNRDNFETPPWESQDKKPFGCGCYGKAHSILYGGRWWLPLSPGHGESSESRVAHGLSKHQGCSKKWTNQLVGWFDAGSSKWIACHSS
jgi:hypothetical protein